MLQDKYLPNYHFDEKHSIDINASVSQVFPCIEHLDFSHSRIIRLLFALRGLPPSMMNTTGLEEHRFYVLERKQDDEIVIGLIGQFWKPSGNLQVFKPNEFIPFAQPGFAKTTWNFKLEILTAQSTRLETVTRIFCTDTQSKIKFSRYWFFIKPFSGLIRKEMLRALKRKVETTHAVSN